MDALTFRKKAIAEVIDREGGSTYTNRAADRGGPTRWGVTERNARAYGYKGDMKDLPYEIAYAIYSANFWDFCKCDQIAKYSQELALWMFDYAVNSGPPAAIAELQDQLNILNQRGKLYPDFAPAANVGPKTIAALDAYCKVRDIKVLAYAFNGCRIAKLKNIAKADETQEDNIYGWYQRVITITKQVGVH